MSFHYRKFLIYSCKIFVWFLCVEFFTRQLWLLIDKIDIKTSLLSLHASTAGWVQRNYCQVFTNYWHCSLNKVIFIDGYKKFMNLLILLNQVIILIWLHVIMDPMLCGWKNNWNLIWIKNIFLILKFSDIWHFVVMKKKIYYRN